MGNTTTKIGNAWDDDGETYVMVDRRGVILDLPEAPGVAELLRTRGHDAVAVASRPPAPATRPLIPSTVLTAGTPRPPAAVPAGTPGLPQNVAPTPPAPAPFWLRWPFRAKPKTRISG